MSGTTVMAPAVDISSISSFSRRSHSTPDLPSLPSRSKSPSLGQPALTEQAGKSLAEFATFEIPSFSTDLDLKLDISLPPLALESQPPPSTPSENDDPKPPSSPTALQHLRTRSAASNNDGPRSWLRSLTTIRDAPFASFKRSWMPLSRAHAKTQSEAPAATNMKPEAKSSLDKLKRAATASITEIATNQTSQGRLVDAGAKPATKGFARATSYFSRIKQKPATALSKTGDSIGSDFSCASSATSLAQPGSSSIDTHVSQSASSAETNSTALTADESASEMPARIPDPLWSHFKNLDLEIRGFASKPVAQQCALVKTLLLPFLKSATSQQPLGGLRPEDVDCRASVLNKWWSAVLDMLEVQHQQPVPGLDRQLLFETATTVMMRMEWRQTTPYFLPLADRSPQDRDRVRARSSTNSSNSSQTSDQSALLAESAEHNIRTMFVSNLVRQMAFVVEKMSLRHVPPSLIEFAGKTCAYAFFFAPGVADILVRLWGLTPDLIRRVSESMGLGRNSNEPVDEEIVASFPPKLSSLAWSSPRTLWTTLKRIPKMPLLVARVPWTGPWVMRWKGRDTDLLFIFCRYFHLLSDQFMPEGRSLTEKAQSPAFVLVHAQLLSILDGTIHRQAALEPPQAALLAKGAEAAALQMPMPPNNMMKSMAENRLVVLLKDILADGTLEYAGARHTFAQAFSALLKAATSRTSRYNSTACSMLCDLLEEVLLIYHRAETDEYPTCYIDWPFWIDVCKIALSSLNTLSEIRMISFIFTVWDAIAKDPEQKLLVCRDWLLTEETFNAFFNNWCPMVRAYYMRLLCWRICRDRGSQNEIDMEIFMLASKRLKSVWSHYLYLKQAAEEAHQAGPATAPMSPTLGKRFIIIKHEVAVPQPGLFATFDTFTKASSIISLANDTNSDPTVVTKSDPKRKWSFLKLLSFGSTASTAQNNTEASASKPSADEGLQNARREVANSRARQITPATPPKTAGSDNSADSDGSNPVYEEPKFTFKFVLGWPQPQQQAPSLDRTLACPRLPTPAQSRLGFKPKRGGGPTLPPLMIPTRKFSGSSQSGLVQAARNANASPLGSPVLEAHRQPFASGGAIPEEEASMSGSEADSGISIPSDLKLFPSPNVQPTPSEEWTGEARVGPVKPAGAFLKNLVYSGRALSEWSLVVAECNNFVERRRDEGVASLDDVEVPLLGVEGFRKMAG
ncbi:DUF1765-domain-containing protein [Trichoderma citrinoviride]|uniref:DUF1765-domain-containing protein n=1 Tax=Trichoderma citrinoviride TaxID=58853 RepID=A0A2T4BKV4_9HYPO|nr:DUF1765-domain-containing protein [Trichoderma citrinoviride]PTB69937.1 DUF1765-domain-containing protein [Trichoderma citrinoviride]